MGHLDRVSHAFGGAMHRKQITKLFYLSQGIKVKHMRTTDFEFNAQNKLHRPVTSLNTHFNPKSAAYSQAQTYMGLKERGQVALSAGPLESTLVGRSWSSPGALHELEHRKEYIFRLPGSSESPTISITPPDDRPIRSGSTGNNPVTTQEIHMCTCSHSTMHSNT